MTFLKGMIVVSRLIAFWNFADGYRYAMSGNYVPAAIKFVMTAFILLQEASWLVKRIEKE